MTTKPSCTQLSKSGRKLSGSAPRPWLKSTIGNGPSPLGAQIVVRRERSSRSKVSVTVSIASVGAACAGSRVVRSGVDSVQALARARIDARAAATWRITRVSRRLQPELAVVPADDALGVHLDGHALAHERFDEGLHLLGVGL